jgi:branched-chain amino acid transport system permease protein
MIGIYTMLGMGLNILTGYVGQLCWARGLFGIGAYTGALMTCGSESIFVFAACRRLSRGAVRACFWGLPTCGSKETYLAIVTLGFRWIARMAS